MLFLPCWKPKCLRLGQQVPLVNCLCLLRGIVHLSTAGLLVYAEWSHGRNNSCYWSFLLLVWLLGPFLVCYQLSALDVQLFWKTSQPKKIRKTLGVVTALVLLYSGLQLVQKTRAIPVTNQTSNENRSWIGRPRFPALWVLCLLSTWILIG